jgi:DegV family protein with EDD domain
MAVRVVTDSTSYIPRELRDEYGIIVVSLGVVFSDGQYREEDIENEWFYRKMAESGEVPTSSQPSLGELTDAFESVVRAGDEVVGVFISADMSGTLSGAELAAQGVRERVPDAVIELVDARSNSMQLGAVVLAAARAAAAGGSVADVVRSAEETRLRTRFVFTPDTLDYLRRGGRIGGASALLGSILQVKPILTVEGGQVEALEKVRTRRRAHARLVEIVVADVARAGLEELWVHHIDDEVEGGQVAAMLAAELGREVPLVSIGPVVGLHVGPGTVGIVLQAERPLRNSIEEAPNA